MNGTGLLSGVNPTDVLLLPSTLPTLPATRERTPPLQPRRFKKLYRQLTLRNYLVCCAAAPDRRFSPANTFSLFLSLLQSPPAHSFPFPGTFLFTFYGFPGATLSGVHIFTIPPSLLPAKPLSHSLLSFLESAVSPCLYHSFSEYNLPSNVGSLLRGTYHYGFKNFQFTKKKD